MASAESFLLDFSSSKRLTLTDLSMEQQMVDEKISICFLSLTSKGSNGRLEATIKIVSSANHLEIVI